MADFSRRGEYQKKEKKERAIIVTSIAGLAGVLVFCMVAIGPLNELQMANRMLNADPVEATVTRFRNDEYDWYANASFVLKDKTIEVNLIDYPSDLQVGQKLYINYDPVDPKKATANAADLDANAKSAILWGIMLSIIVPVLTLVYMNRYVRTGEGAIDTFQSTSNSNW